MSDHSEFGAVKKKVIYSNQFSKYQQYVDRGIKPNNHPRSKYDVEDIANKLAEYIHTEKCPSIPEFAYLYGIPRTSLYNFKALEYLLDMLMCKRRTVLEKATLNGHLHPYVGVNMLNRAGGQSEDEPQKKIEQKAPTIVINVLGERSPLLKKLKDGRTDLGQADYKIIEAEHEVKIKSSEEEGEGAE